MSTRDHNKLCRIAIPWLIAVHLCSSASAAFTAEFETQLQEAEATYKENAQLLGPESWVIELSPKTRLANGIGDVSTIGTVVVTGHVISPLLSQKPSVAAGDCKGDIDSFCSTVKAGRRRLADCLQAQVAKQESGNVQGTESCLETCLLSSLGNMCLLVL